MAFNLICCAVPPGLVCGTAAGYFVSSARRRRRLAGLEMTPGATQMTGLVPVREAVDPTPILHTKCLPAAADGPWRFGDTSRWGELLG